MSDRALLALVVHQPTGKAIQYACSFSADHNITDYAHFKTVMIECGESDADEKWTEYGSHFRSILRGKNFRDSLPA